MKKTLKTLLSPKLGGQRGATIVLVAVLLIVIVGFAALAIDVSHLYLVRNELQNASDAGALAGARVLYNDDGTSINSGANQEAYDAATANNAATAGGALPVDVNWTSGNTGDVQRGHWSFSLKKFTPDTYNTSTPINLAIFSTDDLDIMNGEDFTAPDGTQPFFVNAVKVVARRGDTPGGTPAASFFARLFGYQNFALSAEAVAYRGFAGNLLPTEAEQPVAICKQAITDDDGNVTCNTGRMFNSGGGATHNTAAWTNFSQPCITANPSNSVVCAGGNRDTINFGAGMGTVGGQQTPVYKQLRDCWLGASLSKDWRGFPIERWTQTLPVIDCPANNPGPCSDVVGAVTVDFLWVTDQGTDSHWKEIPVQMEGWECSHWVAAGRPRPANSNDLLNETLRHECWQEFASTFNLNTADGTSVGDLAPNEISSTMYFLPSCEPHEPSGITGGQNFGILARIPVLVQ